MPFVLVAVPDLLLQSRILDAARRRGVPTRVASTPEEALAHARAGPALVVLDLESPRLKADQVLEALKADPALAGVRTLGFYGHVHRDLAQRMLALGLGEAMARGEFLRQLEDLLAPLAT
jgi:CheY-like chemotaxis protein